MAEFSLSIIVPARNEVWLPKTIENILENSSDKTEVIAILDGYWTVEPIKDHPRVTLVHHTVPIGQRAATNEGARLSRSKFIMKVDAHCAFEKDFDTKLMSQCEYDWTVIPRMYNLHAFDWKCMKCGFRWYMGPDPTKCEKCDNTSYFEKVILWQPRNRTRTDFARFDKNLIFQYWPEYSKRPEAKPEIADVMCSIGACWMMHRERYWELGGMDEAHGSWGQMGVELACKTWLSGGRQVVNKQTWFAHMFRTRPGFGFPYPISKSETDKAREYSRWLWTGNNWKGATKPFSYIIDKFKPVPTWS